MIATTIIKTILPLFGYPRFPKRVSGPHALIGSHRLRIPNSTACQIFYPASLNPTSSKSESRRHPYFRAEAAEGVADWIKSSDSTLLSFLNASRHPCLIDATPQSSAATTGDATTDAESDTVDTDGQSPPSSSTYPVVIFSHGLGGTMEMYTELCRNIASHGFVVFAMEHEDGSASFAEKVDGERIYYKRPDDTPYSREKVLKLRGPMYEIRLGEVEGLLRYLDSYPKDIGGSHDSIGGRTVSETFHEVMAVADLTNGVSLLGHSFGATTMVYTQQCLQHRSATTNHNTHPRINSVAILDPWCFSLSDTSLTTGITPTPLLAILSAKWGTNGESPQVLQLLQNSNSASASTVLWAPRSVHSSFSDTTGWMPRFVGRKMGMRGGKEGRHETAGAAAEVCARFFRREQGKHVTGSLAGGGDGRAVTEEEELHTSCGTAILPFAIL